MIFAYINFCEKIRRKVKEDNPTASFSKIASILRNTWNNMSEHEKEVYDKLQDPKFREK